MTNDTQNDNRHIDQNINLRRDFHTKLIFLLRDYSSEQLLNKQTNKQTHTNALRKATSITLKQTPNKKNIFTMAIQTAKKFSPSSIFFGEAERNKMGGKFVPLTNEIGAKSRFTLQTPTMSLPFGISAYREKPEAEPSSYSVDLSFRGYETDENVLTLFNKITELDNHLIDAAYTNSVAWFGKQKSRELLEDTYRPLTKKDPSGKYAPVMKVKIPILNGKPNVQVFDVDKTPISIDEVQKGSTVKVITEVASVWFVGGTQWGITFRALQILVVSKPARLDEFAFTDDDEEAPKEILEVSDDDAAVAQKFL